MSTEYSLEFTENTYKNNTNIETVDLGYLSWRYNSMQNAFQNCSNLISVNNINNNVTTLYNAFGNCTNLINTPVIPESVTELSYAFRNCPNLINATPIPNSVNSMWETFGNCRSLVNAPDMSNANNVEILYLTFIGCSNLVNAPDLSNCSNLSNMYGTFISCSNLVEAPVIPNSVTNVERLFLNCSNLVEAPVIPNSVNSMELMFQNCYNLVNAPEIPNSVEKLNFTFDKCYNLVNAPVIPNSVVDMSGTFNYCSNLVNAPEIPNSVEKLYGTTSRGGMAPIFGRCFNLTGDVNIKSEKIYSAYNCFYGTSLEKNVYIPFKYQTNGTKNLYKIFINNNEYIVDKNPVTHWGKADILYPNGVIQLNSDIKDLYIYSRNDGYVNLEVYYTNNVSSEYNYAVSDYPEYNYIINYNTNDYTFTYNAFIAAGYSTTNRVNGALLMDLNEDPSLFNWRYNTLDNGVRLLYEYLGNESSISVPNNNTMINDYNSRNQADMPFYNKQQFISVDLNNARFANNSMSNAFVNSQNLASVSNIPNNITDISRTFYNCSNLTNVSELPNDISGMWFSFAYCFNLVNAPEIPNSVTSMYQTFAHCEKMVNTPIIPNSVTNMTGTFAYCYNLVNATLPNSVIDLRETFVGCSNLVNAPIIPNSVTDMGSSFFNCINLQYCNVISNNVVNMRSTFMYCSNLTDVGTLPDSIIDMSRTFQNCANLQNCPIIPNNVVGLEKCFENCRLFNNVSNIPNTIISLYNTFYDCSNITNASVIPSNVQCMESTFSGCSNLTGDIIIHSDKIMRANNCFALTSLEKNVYIPFKYVENGSETLYAYYCNFVDTYFYSTLNYSELDKADLHILFDKNFEPLGNNFYATPGHYLSNGVYGYKFEEDSANNVTIIHNEGDYTRTYNAFINAGYSDTIRIDGALLIDINDEGIDLGDYEFNMNLTRDVELTKYIGNDEIIVTPHLI